jgi:predicted nuclease of predicted toxin-antitoxin system
MKVSTVRLSNAYASMAIRLRTLPRCRPGIMDEVVLMESRISASVLITADKDFGELVFRQRQASTGVMLIRLWGLTPAMKAAVVSGAIQEHGQELPGAFAVLSPGNIRIRREVQP